MQTITLGRTGLNVTVAGLGTGGFSRIGFFSHGTEHAAAIVRNAFDEGVNFFDSSPIYGTESAVGAGLEGISRDKYVISSKFPYKDYGDKNGSLKSAEELMAALENSLRLMRTDHIDIYHLHAVSPGDYDIACDRYIPTLQKAQQQGKIRFAGISEIFDVDNSHEALQMALKDDFFDVMMIGYNLLNPSAAKTILPAASAKGIGTLCMFAVRNALSNPEYLKKTILQILDCNQADKGLLSPDEGLSFLLTEGGAKSIAEAAYRFCRHTAGMDVVLTGTGNLAHLKENLASIQMPPLPKSVTDKLQSMFGNVDCVSGQ